MFVEQGTGASAVRAGRSEDYPDSASHQSAKTIVVQKEAYLTIEIFLSECLQYNCICL